jgi:hypothetical protein
MLFNYNKESNIRDQAKKMNTQDHVAIQIEEQRSQTTYQIPPKMYVLRRTIHPIVDIGRFTEQLQLIPQPYREYLFHRLWVERANMETLCSELSAPSDVEILKRIIGDNGHYLKLTTQNCNVDFIWHDREANLFRFWAPKKYNLIQAMNIIRGRIIKYVAFQANQEQAYEPGQAYGPYGRNQNFNELFMKFPRPPSPPMREARSPSPEPVMRHHSMMQRSMSTYPTDLAASPEPNEPEPPRMMQRSMSMCPRDNLAASPEPASRSANYTNKEDEYDMDTDDEMPALI